MDQSPTPQPQPQPPVEPVQPTPAPIVMPTLEQPDPVPAADAQPVPNLEPAEDAVSVAEPAFMWQASEYLHHEKSIKWYGALAIILVILLGIAWLTHQWLSIGVFIAAAIAIVVYARKPPRTLTYELTPSGIAIDGHPYPFEQFRSFAVLQDIAWHTIDLEPTQRFMPRLAILFEDDSFDTIIGHLAEHLPRVDREPDAIERLTRYLRF